MSIKPSSGCVIDFKDCVSAKENSSNENIDALKNVGKRIIDSFKEYGFCYLENHGVDENLLEEYMRVSRTFFEQSAELKGKYPLGRDYTFGWVKLERETLNLKRSVGDLHEAFNYTKNFDTAWPPVDKFEALTKQVYEAGKVLTFRFCDALSLGLDLPVDFMQKAHTGEGLQVRTIYYPIIEDSLSVATDQARLGEHTDWGTFTFNFQDNTGGLEVQNPKGEFVAADPIPGTVVVTPSVLLQRWTSDVLKGPLHRILVPDDGRRKKVRQAIIYFVNPDGACEIKCMDGTDKYEPILAKDYWNSRAAYSMKYE